jgi:hypothetical protein
MGIRLPKQRLEQFARVRASTELPKNLCVGMAQGFFISACRIR